MAERYDLPTVADLITLGERHGHAITIYANTSPEDPATAQTLVKSAFDTAIRTIRGDGARFADEEALRERYDQIAHSGIWRSLSGSLAILIADDVDEVFVLPNDLEDQVQIGPWFDLGQLVRAVTTPQTAYALTLSQDGWNLWRATPTQRAAELALPDSYPSDIAEATNRATVRDRGHVRRLVGDEGRKVLLEQYATRVAEAVQSQIGGNREDEDAPLFVFGVQPLLDLYLAADSTGRTLVPVSGASDELQDHQVDEAIRAGLPAVNTERLAERLERIGDGTAQGLVAHDLADIARAAAIGAVDTLVYDFTVDVLGEMDESGAIRYDEHGYDLLSRIAVQVLSTGGRAVAVREDEVDAAIWTPPAVAGLRYTLA